MLFNRDLNLLCQIGEIRKAEIAEKDGKLLRIWQEKVIKENCPANRRKVAYLKEDFKVKEVKS